VRNKAPKPAQRDATPLPISESRGAFVDWLQKKPWDEQRRILTEMNGGPDGAAMKRLEELLTAAHFDPLVTRSETLSAYVFLVREVLADYIPGMTLGNMLEPLRTVLARHGGGRRTNEETWERWAQMVAEKRVRNRIATMEEIFDDVAAEWEAMGNKGVTGRGIANAMCKLKKLKKAKE